MMLTPWGPSAVPTGGAGVAFPAGICNFTMAVTFFAITLSYFPLNFFDLEEIQLHRRSAAENRHQHAQSAAFRIDFVHLAREVVERPIDDAHILAFFEAELRARPFGRACLAIQNRIY